MAEDKIVRTGPHPVAFLLCVHAECMTRHAERGCIVHVIGQASRLRLPRDEYVEELAIAYVNVQMGIRDRESPADDWMTEKPPCSSD